MDITFYIKEKGFDNVAALIKKIVAIEETLSSVQVKVVINID